MRPDESKCIICGKEIDEWGGFATLVYYDEADDGSINLYLQDWSPGGVYMCKECWEKVVKNIDKIKKLLEKGVTLSEQREVEEK